MSEQNEGLIEAIMDCNTGAVEDHFSQGADVNVRDLYGWTPLHFAANCADTDIAGILLEKGADVHARSDDGSTPLLIAANNGRSEVITLLLGAGADVHDKDENGATALIYAANNGTTKK
jgi:ankyrin repeat protein